MADLVDHLAQAWHNEELAAKLVTPRGLSYRDWLITIAFYAAVHYVEALFFTVVGIVHTEVACRDGEAKHAFRENKVADELGRTAWESYRKLRNASHVARYLPFSKGTQGTGFAYFTRQDASDLYLCDLKTVRDAVGQHIDVSPD